jgi:hypothetical protein
MVLLYAVIVTSEKFIHTFWRVVCARFLLALWHFEMFPVIPNDFIEQINNINYVLISLVAMITGFRKWLMV